MASTSGPRTIENGQRDNGRAATGNTEVAVAPGKGFLGYTREGLTRALKSDEEICASHSGCLLSARRELTNVCFPRGRLLLGCQGLWNYCWCMYLKTSLSILLRSVL